MVTRRLARNRAVEAVRRTCRRAQSGTARLTLGYRNACAEPASGWSSDFARGLADPSTGASKLIKPPDRSAKGPPTYSGSLNSCQYAACFGATSRTASGSPSWNSSTQTAWLLLFSGRVAFHAEVGTLSGQCGSGSHDVVFAVPDPHQPGCPSVQLTHEPTEDSPAPRPPWGGVRGPGLHMAPLSKRGFAADSIPRIAVVSDNAVGCHGARSRVPGVGGAP
jgi:hypothetical protein